MKKAIEEELIVYGRLQMPLQFDAGPLKFWHMQSCKLPYLAALAFQILGIPASTSQVERLFSAAGRAIGRRRPRLSAKRGAQIIYMAMQMSLEESRAVRFTSSGFQRAERAELGKTKAS